MMMPWSGAPTPLSRWWWLLTALLVTGVLMSVLRAWLAARRRAAEVAHGKDRARASVTVPARANAALQDPLTGLATRLSLEDQLAAATMRADARHHKLALLYIDLDGFKPVNEALGYAGGDTLLSEVGQRLAHLGGDGGAVARFGGDEFLMLLDGDPDAATAALVADRVRIGLQQPYALPGQAVRLSCSIGIVLYPEHGPRGKLIARADAAMRAAKQAGGDMHCFFDLSMDHDAEGAVALQRDLRQAMDTGMGLALHYQPKIDGRTGRFVGAEALLRWQHPVRGMVPPAEFIAIAERFGLIRALGQWAIDEACRQVREWMDQGLVVPVAVNLSVHQLRQADLADRMEAALLRHDVSADLITLEVGEPAAMTDVKATMRVFERLSSRGVALSIDDFGSGASALLQLRKWPARQLKIDLQLVQGVDQDDDARAVVRAAIQLAHALDMLVVAEGVETDGQLEALRCLGCDEMQGHLFARPMPPHKLPAWAAGDDLPVNRPAFRTARFGQDA